ncbi:MAG TPA: Ig-like domain-containing protein [Gemmataceae bacterium]|jgi:predicted flap endonuclease-1-like 5' DNA nuclease|nr:Ig-like domain-containing protein [Gemmataceae bacterium]
MRRRWMLEELDARIVPTYQGNQLFPLDNPWNQVIAGAPVASNSTSIINTIVNRHNGTAPKLHADFGSPLDQNLYGIPINVATHTTPKYTIYFPPEGYPDESDIVQVPIPANAVIEGDFFNGPSTPADRGDSHLLVYDKDANVLYELYQAIRPSETAFPYGGTKPNTTQWGAYQISVWDMNVNSFRTIGATSADAAGLPIFPGLVRPDEANPASTGGVGVIDHAIRMTVASTASSFIYPASHHTGGPNTSTLPRMGDRFRLKASFVIPTTWSPEAQAIATAMKTYGMIVADNGSDMYFTGMPSDKWTMDSVLQVQAIKATDFEVIDLTPAVTGLSTSTGNTGASVTITGRNFGGAGGQLHVLFGNVEASSITIVSDTQVVAVAPAHAAGMVDVQVQSGTDRLNTDGVMEFFGYGTSATSAADHFTFGGTPPSAPTANADAFSILHDHTLTISAALGVLSNDASNPSGHPLTAVLGNGPAHGTLTLNTNGSFTYKPTAGYSGSDSFAYTANDAGVASSPATVTLSVTDQAPAAIDDSYTAGMSQTLTVVAAGLLANDTDADGDALTAILGAGPAHGSLTLNANGSFTYTPAAGYSGSDTFTYRANDKAASSALATVNLLVAPPPQVRSVSINDGSAQRSMVRSLTITFDTLVTVDSGAFQVKRSNGTIAGLKKTVTTVNGVTQVVLTFTSTGTYGGSLTDGLWTLKVIKTKVHRADFHSTVMAADSVTSFHRLFGDSDGDRDVDAADQSAFNAAYGQTNAPSLATFDFDHDGDIDATDRTKFNTRFGQSI